MYGSHVHSIITAVACYNTIVRCYKKKKVGILFFINTKIMLHCNICVYILKIHSFSGQSAIVPTILQFFKSFPEFLKSYAGCMLCGRINFYFLRSYWNHCPFCRRFSLRKRIKTTSDQTWKLWVCKNSL